VYEPPAIVYAVNVNPITNILPAISPFNPPSKELTLESAMKEQTPTYNKANPHILRESFLIASKRF
jgi:hypothetical protein